MRDVSRRVWLYAASAVLVPWTSVHAQNLTEADAVARALAASPRVRAANAAPIQAEAEYRVRRVVPNPTVRFQQADAAGTRDRFLLVDQELPLSGRRGLLAQASTEAVVPRRGSKPTWSGETCGSRTPNCSPRARASTR